MSNKPLVSVIIIFLNAEKFIREAIESVFAQTYDNWELLLVDDGSTDASTEITKGYVDRDPQKVRYLDHEGHQNKGMSAARNLGIAYAHGEYVAFLDADDVWLQDKLERQAAIMERHPDIALIANPAFYWYQDGIKKPQPMTLSPGPLPPGAWIPKILESDCNAACPSTVLMRSTLAAQLGGFEESFRGPLMAVEDQVMWFKVSLSAPIYYDPNPVVLYRFHSMSCCATIPADQLIIARIHLYSRLLEFLKHRNRLQFNSRLLAVMARGRLCKVLLELAGQSLDGTENPVVDGRLSRFRTSLKFIRTYIHSVGPFFSGLLLLGAVSGRVASALCGGIFVFSRTAYNDGLLQATKALARHLLVRVQNILPGPCKRIGRRVLGLMNVSKATRVRLAGGLQPLSYSWGGDRGMAICRYYLEQFLREFASDIQGHCLEFQEDLYTTRFGGSGVTQLDILHIDGSNLRATIVADLTKPNEIPTNRFDCIICTHVLHVIFELDMAIAELYRILRPGGVLLVAVPHISMSGPRDHEIWRFTSEGLHLLLAKAFGPENVTVRAYGNSLTGAGQIRGLVAHEFAKAELDYHDPRFAVEVCARVVKPIEPKGEVR